MSRTGLSGALVFVLLFFAFATSIKAQTVCSDPLLSVSGGAGGDHTMVCDLAVEAKLVLRQCGLVQERPVTFELRKQVVTPVEHCAAYYALGLDRIEILEPSVVSSIMPSSSVFAPLESDTYYASLIVHELAHAFSDQATGGQMTCSADLEYIAYALQIESLPEAEREAVVASREVDATFETERINEIILFFEPDLFALYAWTHFSGLENGCEFVQALLTGDATLALPEM